MLFPRRIKFAVLTSFRDVISAIRSLLQGYATACLALLQLGMYNATERADLALAQEQPWVR